MSDLRIFALFSGCKASFWNTEEKVFSYYDRRDNWKLFDIVTQYRMMIRSAKDRRIADTTETLIYFGKRIDGFFGGTYEHYRDHFYDKKGMVIL